METLLPAPHSANRVKGPSCSGVLPPKGAFREPAVLPQLIRGCKWQEGSEAKEGSCCAKCSGIPWLSKMGNGCGVAADLQPPARNVSAEEGRRMLREKVRIRAVQMSCAPLTPRQFSLLPASPPAAPREPLVSSFGLLLPASLTF